MSIPPIPRATQPQIIRAHQKDLFSVFRLREETENVLRSWLGTRWLTRWDKEVEFLSKVVYYGFTTLRGIQTLGEEYVDISTISMIDRRPPSFKLRAGLVLLLTLPSYLLSRLTRHMSQPNGYISNTLNALPNIFEALTEINLALFYLTGRYYSLTNRVLRIRHMSAVAPDPNSRPPSYSFLGILLSTRLLYRLITLLSPFLPSLSTLIPRSNTQSDEDVALSKATYIDQSAISSLVPSVISPSSEPSEDEKDAWGDRTILDVESLPPPVRAGRKCALCLEERTASSVTECGHVFCWTCVVGWGREKAECPLCRQSLDLTRILPLYNL
ncbi:hypothetical protein BS47DRAFT_1287934 [Hydnum rufescens UP504]|uniref:RING-type E3 ubiquitin transferase n=1 Tax=Hydnum rufescens UP504 TaxID=1448309 RepID=A0A9P6B968_9AGAM|nr:hypothetical protein BS47DRAFT_1287934 [Hydnum rufescens UP504]